MEENIYCSIRSRTFPHLQALAIAELNELERVLDGPDSFHFKNPLAGSALSLKSVSLAGSRENLSISMPNLATIENGENEDGTAKKLDPGLLSEIEAKFEQLDKMLTKFDKLEQAKTIAMEQATQALRKHTAEQIEVLQIQQQKLLQDLEKRHTKDIETIKETQKEFHESLAVLKDTLASVYTGLSLKQFNRNNRDSGYAGSDTESAAYDSFDTSNDTETLKNRARITEQVSVRLDDMLNQIPNIMWKQRTVAQFVSGSTVPRLGAFKECFMSQDYKKVTKLKAYSFCEDKEGPSISTLRRRARSEMSLYNDGEELCISPPLQIGSCHPRLLYHLSKKGSYPGGIHNPVDASFLPNGNVLIAEYGNGRLQEFDSKGKSITLFTAKTTLTMAPAATVKFKPQGVTMTQEGYVAATDGQEKNIQIFTRGGDLVCKFGTGYFKDPSAIVESGRDTYLTIDNGGAWQQCVFKYNAMSGEKTRVGYDERGTNVISQPEYICVDKISGNVLVSDSLVHCVWVFNLNLELLFRLGKDNDNSDHNLSHPKGICSDQEGNILVADCANHRVAKFSPDGGFIGSVLDASHGLNYPQVVASSKEGKIAVVANSEVLVFET